MDAIDQAVAVLARGGLVAFPTETVYGLGADARNETAVRRIFAVKDRPPDHPLIVHIGAADRLDEWARDVTATARTLAATFWPGPLTLVVRRAPDVLDAVTGGLDTVGLRVPAHPMALDLLARFRGGLAAPSANRFGRVSPTTARHVSDDLDGDVDLILDGGPCAVGVESTIVDVTAAPLILRPGGIAAEDIERVLQMPVRADEAGPARAPGMLQSHYAPHCRVEVVRLDDAEARAAELTELGNTVRVLDASDAITFAPRLYAELRQADADGIDVILATLPDAFGVGAAVADRLRKAAAPRELDDRP